MAYNSSEAQKSYRQLFAEQGVRGRTGGRPKGLSQEATYQAYAAETLYKYTIAEICKQLGISRGTLYLKYRNVKIDSYERKITGKLIDD